MGGQGMQAGATRTAMAMPAMLTQDPGERDPVDVDDEEEW
jgi:hypothetical protein